MRSRLVRLIGLVTGYLVCLLWRQHDDRVAEALAAGFTAADVVADRKPDAAWPDEYPHF